jgi:hypothetical protein
LQQRCAPKRAVEAFIVWRRRQRSAMHLFFRLHACNLSCFLSRSQRRTHGARIVVPRGACHLSASSARANRMCGLAFTAGISSFPLSCETICELPRHAMHDPWSRARRAEGRADLPAGMPRLGLAGDHLRIVVELAPALWERAQRGQDDAYRRSSAVHNFERVSHG